jgi:hypothetical protein
MADDTRGSDAAAVLETVRAYFTNATGRTELLHGPLRDWATLSIDLRPGDEFEREFRLESAEILDLGPSSAVVDLRADEVIKQRGRRVRRFDYSGHVLLEKVREDWRIVDFALSGARRLAGVVTGLLAEQEQASVVVRVLGIDQGTGGLLVVVELENGSPDEIAIERAFLRLGRAWARAWIGQRDPTAPGGRGRILLAADQHLSVQSDEASVALVVAAASEKVPLVLRVPLGEQSRPWRGEAPRRLPLRLRATLPAFLSVNAVVTALVAWQFGWVALLIPIAIGAQFFRAYRSTSSPPEWFQRFRLPFAAALFAALGLVFWNTSFIQFALPGAIAVAAYAVLRRADWAAGRRAAVASVAAGAAFFFLFGTTTKPLSPCRLFGGDAAAPADAFTREMLVGDMNAARQYGIATLDDNLQAEPFPIAMEDAEAAVRNRTGTVCHFLFVGRIPNCFSYAVRTKTGASYTVTASTTCDGRHWRVNSWSHGNSVTP